MSAPRLLVADAEIETLVELRTILEPDLQMVGLVGNGRDVVAAVEALAPDLVMLAISLPGRNGIDVARELSRLRPGLAMLIRAAHADAVYADEAMRAGARGFVLRGGDAAELRHAIAEVLAGRSYVTPLVPRATPPEGTNVHPLTPRQVEVLRLVAQGCTTVEIAGQLGVTPKAVEFHRARIKRALGLRTNAALVRYAVARGIV
ncbi:MAG TPA: response regulator transcription factor [Gemmatimonadaceae bacterium]